MQINVMVSLSGERDLIYLRQALENEQARLNDLAPKGKKSLRARVLADILSQFPESEDQVREAQAEVFRAIEQQDREQNPDWAEIADIKKDRLAELRKQTSWADPT